MKFRGQYAVCREPRAVPEGFVAHQLGEYQLLVHSELPTAISGGAALVGHCFDWRDPGKSLDDILEYLLPDPIARSYGLAGRWALIVPGHLALSDACGAMGVVYSSDAIAASAKLLEFVSEPLTRLDDWEKDTAYSGCPRYGVLTDFVGVRKLLANHFLDWGKGPVRFHSPVAGSLPAALIAPRIAEMLQGIVAAAANRQSIAVGTTAGYDSRVIAAAVGPAQYHTFTDKFACPPGHYDVEGGRKVAQTAGGTHRVIPAPNRDDPIARASESMPTRKFEAYAQACRTHFRDNLILSGWCSEVGRNFYRWDDPDPQSIQAKLGGPDDLTDWFNTAPKSIHILDLAYWELRCQWVSASLNILFTGCDWVPVYSCRELLDAMLSVREEERATETHRQVIQLLCPELLEIPFNPKRYWRETIRRWIMTNARNWAIRITKRLGVYERLRAIRA